MNIKANENERYSRQLKLQEIGSEGQEKLAQARVLVVGAGGLGCPVLQYLAAAGVGSLGVMDFDIVSADNLHRQILFSEGDIGKLKAACAVQKLINSNPDLKCVAINEKLTVLNIRKIFSEYDIIVDGSDNFSTRYLINDGCLLSHKPYVYGSLFKFNAQIAVFNQLLPDGTRSSNYRDIFPDPPLPGEVPDCSEAGVLGSVAGIAGTFQATEVIKMIVGAGNTLSGKMILIDSLNLSFQVIQLLKSNTETSKFPQSWEALEQYDYTNFCPTRDIIETIDNQSFENLLTSGHPVQIVDVREEWEHSGPLMPLPVFNIPLHNLDANMYKLNASIPIVVICTSGKRSNFAVKLLRRNGFPETVSLEGGIDKWTLLQKA